MAAIHCDVCEKNKNTGSKVVCDDCFTAIELKLRELQGKVLTQGTANSLMSLINRHAQSQKRSTTVQKPKKSAAA